MGRAARLGDTITPIVFTEHSGHETPHTGTMTGSISGGCSPNVYINGISAARVNSTTLEKDTCCGSNTGRISSGSGKVFINGISAARSGDSVATHIGSHTTINGGSNNVNIL